MLAHQVAGKAARDGLFLSQFDATALPKMVAGAAAFALIAGLWFAKTLVRRGPRRTLPIALGASVLFHLAEYGFVRVNPDLVVVLTYLHIVGLGAILLSLFWSFVTESFDPREAKVRFGRIAGAGTAGGIIGGLLAERCVTWFSLESLLLLLAALHAASATVVALFPSDGMSIRSTGEQMSYRRSMRQALTGAPFLKSLGLLVMFSTISAALLDYLFKSGAVVAFGKGPALARYFAIFYTVNQLASFLMQTLVTPVALRSLGLGRTVMSLPLAVFAGAGGALLIPAFWTTGLARAAELLLRGSLFRSAYELFYTPIPPREKRAVKTVIDVGCDRIGDALGAGAIQLLILADPRQVFGPTLFVTMLMAVGGIWIAARMDRAYLRVLERGLLHRVVDLDVSEIHDSTTANAVRQAETKSKQRLVTPDSTSDSDPMPATVRRSDPAVDKLQELRSGDLTKVRLALKSSDFYALAVPQVIRLLAWNEIAEDARQYLSGHATRVAGQLTDALLDAEQDFAVRRRIPRILTLCPSQRVVEGLTDVLQEPRFEIRFQASRALEYLHRSDPALRFDEQILLEVIERELSVSRPIWQGRRLLDERQDSGEYAYLDDVLRDRANQSLEHVFSLLAITIPREPLKAAFRALHSEDRMLRGLALEYLETTLPGRIFEHLTKMLEADGVAGQARDPRAVLQDLMASQPSILLKLRSPSDDAASLDATLPKATQS